MHKLNGISAWTNIMKAPASQWHGQIGRFSEPLVDIRHDAKFKIDIGDDFFCIGSCFARNIEEHLIYNGIAVQSRRIVSPKTEWSARPNGFTNKFTTHSIRNEIEWVINRPHIDETMFEERADGWVDLQLSPGIKPVTLERAIERRAYLTDEYFSRVRGVSVIVLTLGLNEVWFDRALGRHLNAAPSFYAVRRQPDRYELQSTDFADNLSELHEIHG